MPLTMRTRSIYLLASVLLTYCGSRDPYDNVSASLAYAQATITAIGSILGVEYAIMKIRAIMFLSV